MTRAVESDRGTHDATVTPVNPSSTEGAPDRDELSRHLAGALWRTHARLVDARSDAAAARGELDAVRRSTSWRVTAPLRLARPRVRTARTAVRRLAKGLWWTVTLQLRSRLRERRRAIADARTAEREKRGLVYEEWIRRYDTLDESDDEPMRALDRSLAYRPLVSILMPVYDPPETVLREAIESVRAQVYGNWELCIADDASPSGHVRRVLEAYARDDGRIRVVFRPENGGISAASNDALGIARGELAGFLDHDDVLRAHALLLAVRAFAESPEVELVYSDEDKIDLEGRRFGHYFKPDWNPALLACQNYVCHFTVVRTELVRRVGGFRSAYDGSQDWDLLLRLTETLPAGAVAHVPHVLYHWRALESSAASSADAKPYARDAGRRAAEDHLRRTGRPGYVLPARDHQNVRYLVPEPRPLVTAIVPTTGRTDLLEPCLKSLHDVTDYAELEILLPVSDERAELATRRLAQQVAAPTPIRAFALPSSPFNFAWTVNRAAERARGSLLLLLNDDTEAIVGDWLETMVGHVLQDGVGAVGATLLSPDGRIQHAGMLVDARGVAEHLYEGRDADVRGYVNRALLTQDVSVVAGTCMLVRREVFDELGGLEERFPVCYNDIDFCLRLRAAGWRVVFAADAVLTHVESASFGTHSGGRERAHERDVVLMQERWGPVLEDDPMHNPNLALDAAYPSRLAFPPRVAYPWRRP